MIKYIIGLTVLSLAAQQADAFTTRICNRSGQTIYVKLNPSHRPCPSILDYGHTLTTNQYIDLPWVKFKTRHGGCMLEAINGAIEVNGESLPAYAIHKMGDYNPNRWVETIFIDKMGVDSFKATLYGGRDVIKCS